MFLARMSINRPVLTTVLILVFLIFGGLAWLGLNLNQMPEVEIPYVTISTIYPGAGPKETETQISKKIEDAVATVSEIEKIESYSLDGVSIVIIEFKLTKDVDVANQEVKNKVDQIRNELPDNAEDPIVEKLDFQAFPIVDVVLSGDVSAKELYEIADKRLKDRFSQIKGVAQVQITGGQEREIHVAVNDRIAFSQSISLPQLMQIMGAYNMDIPGGYFQIQDQEYTVRFEGEFAEIDDMSDLQVMTPYGQKKLRQFAEVRDAGKNIRERAVFFDNRTKTRNENVVRLGIIKSSEGNVVEIAKGVKVAIPEIEELLPEGVTLNIVNDESIFVESSVNDTLSNIFLGILFTSIILFLFLHDLRSTFIVALSMPASIIASFMVMPWFDMSLNMMSLMGLSVSVGVLVANSIVVIENIFRFKAMNKNRRVAAFEGTSEVTVAVLAATLTNVVVFLPIANMSSMVGRFLEELALAAAFATIFSLVMSFTLTPMLAALILPEANGKKKFKITEKIEQMEAFFERLYKRILAGAIKTKMRDAVIVLGSFAILIAIAVYFGPKLGFEFMPTLDNGKVRVDVELPQGYNLDATAEVVKDIESRLKKYDEIENILTNLGKKSEVDLGTNLATMTVSMIDANERERGIQEMIAVFIEELAAVKNAKIRVISADQSGPGSSPIEFFLMGQELDKLEELKVQVIDLIKDIPGLVNFENSSAAGKPEMTIVPDREKLSEVGISVMDLAFTVRASIEGIVASHYREKGEEYDIKVTLDDKSVNTPEKIENIPVVTPTGTFRLSQLADIEFTQGFTKVLHRDKFLAIQFTASNAPEIPVGNITQEISARLDKMDMPDGYTYRWGGMTKMMNEMLADMGFAFLLAILLTYLLLAAVLESFSQPLLILMTLPLAFIGVILSLYFSDIPLNLTSLMAVIMLIGIVVNNAILMLDYANQIKRERKIPTKEALIEGAPVKLKPIIMSTVAIILGMLPLALGIGDAGKEMRVALGVVSIGGLLVSTMLTLFVIPATYSFFSSRKYKEKKEKQMV
ncbi:MAG: efflux RND transporter permease subunit [Candidatus Kapaibacterium sp.]